MSDFERVWEECWTRIAHGEATIEDCARKYPEYAEDLRRLVAVAVRVNQGRVVRPSADFKTRARMHLLEQLRTHPGVLPNQELRAKVETIVAPESRTQSRGREELPGRVISIAVRFGAIAAALVLLLLVSGTMLAQAALPGETLYSWKTGSEEVFRAVYPDPLTADLVVMNRRTDELTRVAGTPAAERVAQDEYQRVLSDLPRYTDPSSQSKIRQGLMEQRTQLQRAGVTVPAIDRTLKNLSAAPAITTTPTRNTNEGKATPTLRPSATVTLSSNSVSPTTKPTTPTATTTPTGTPSRRPTLTPTPTHTRPGTLPRSTPTPTLSPQTTVEPKSRPTATETPIPVRTNTLTPTPCASRSLTLSDSSADPCATPASNCGTMPTDAPPCETPTRTETPANSGGPANASPSITPMHPPTGIPEAPNSLDGILP